MSRADDLTLAGTLGGLHRLPSPRGAALELLRLSAAENTSTAHVARVANADPALAGRLVHAANGTASAGVPQVGSIMAAVLRLGFRATRQIALGGTLAFDVARRSRLELEFKRPPGGQKHLHDHVPACFESLKDGGR